MVTSEEAYVCGTLLGDGYLARGRYRMGLNTISLAFANKFKGILEKLCGKKINMMALKPHPTSWGKKPQYSVRVSSKQIYTRFLELIKNLTWVKNASIEVKRAFICGFFDSEGSLNEYRPPYYEIQVYNNDTNLLKLLKELLESMGIEPSGIYFSCGKTYKLVLYRQSEIAKVRQFWDGKL